MDFRSYRDLQSLQEFLDHRREQQHTAGVVQKTLQLNCIRTVLGSDRRSDRKSAWKLIGSDRQPDPVIIHSKTTQLVAILQGHFKNINLYNLTH